MLSHPPFALFVLVEISIEQLNEVLDAAFKGTQFTEHCLWLPSSRDYSDAPNKVPRMVTEGTKPPLSTYKSPFIGSTGQDVAKWLRDKPKEVDVDIHFFAVLDRSAEKRLMVTGRQGGYDLRDLDNLEFMRHDMEFATSSLFAATSGTWEELMTAGGAAKIEY